MLIINVLFFRKLILSNDRQIKTLYRVMGISCKCTNKK